MRQCVGIIDPPTAPATPIIARHSYHPSFTMSAPGAEWISDRSRDNSPEVLNSTEGQDGSSQRRTSKKRKVLSCYACRNRKMKCDRVFPVCGRCQKTGRGHECTYDPRLLEESHSDAGAASIALAERPADSNPSSDSPDALQWKLRTQERRIAMLEHKLATRDDTRNPTRFEAVVPDEPEIKEEIMFRGKGFKSHFNGATSIMSMISMVYFTCPDPDVRVPAADHHQELRAAGIYTGSLDC